MINDQSPLPSGERARVRGDAANDVFSQEPPLTLTLSPRSGERGLVMLFLVVFAAACSRPETPQTPLGNADRGRQLIAQYACNVCHIVPGTQGPQGRLGPSLAGVALRPVISNGVVRNTPANLRQFIQRPQSLNPQSSMPPIAIPDPDVQDITAFLLTLRD